ncbi:17319_t:CDS:2, partial [Funneliformis caledonium]
MEVDTILSSILAISVISNDKFGIIKYIVELNLSHLENIPIETGKIEELYKIYERFAKKIESEITQTVQENNISDKDHKELLPNRNWQKVLQDNSNI